MFLEAFKEEPTLLHFSSFFSFPNIAPGVETLLILFPKLGSFDSFTAVPY